MRAAQLFFVVIGGAAAFFAWMLRSGIEIEESHEVGNDAEALRWFSNVSLVIAVVLILVALSIQVWPWIRRSRRG